MIAMITSKGASGVTGAGFVTLAATLAIVPDIPIQSLAILLGIDKFMSECRALTNLIGNGVATIVISRWEGELDVDKLHETMAHPIARRRGDGDQPARSFARRGGNVARIELFAPTGLRFAQPQHAGCRLALQPAARTTLRRHLRRHGEEGLHHVEGHGRFLALPMLCAMLGRMTNWRSPFGSWL